MHVNKYPQINKRCQTIDILYYRNESLQKQGNVQSNILPAAFKYHPDVFARSFIYIKQQLR